MLAESAETKLLRRYLRPATRSSHVLVPNGDDAAVLVTAGQGTIVTTDTIVENTHFSRAYFSMHQIGAKAVEAAVSDVLAMGGSPIGCCVAVTAPRLTPDELWSELFNGLYAAADRTGAPIHGGDTTSITPGGWVITVTVLGELRANPARERSHAAPGDAVYVTGFLGGSHTGLIALRDKLAGYPWSKARHLEPQCRVDIAPAVAAAAHAVIDISDGLASEAHHIARASGVAVELDRASIPLHAETIQLATSRSEDPLSYALGGGEDYELLFTAPAGRVVPGTHRIGTVRTGSGVWITSPGLAAQPLPLTGFDHLSPQPLSPQPLAPQPGVLKK